MRLWLDWVKPMIMVVIVLGSIRSAVADWNDVPTGSMKPTILEGDRVFINKVAYDLKIPFTNLQLIKWGDPKRGDIVVFSSPEDGTRLVKRVIGLPGDRIEIRENALFVNGVAAIYEPLAADIFNQLNAEEQRYCRFSREKIGTESHPLMITPGLPALRTFGPVTAPEGHYFVLGDNRDNSRDSRWIGFVDRHRIAGQAKAVALSVDRARYLRPRWHRFFLPLR